MAGRAPGQLGLVQDFVNTLEVDTGRDAIGTADDLSAWLDERGLLRGERAGEADRSLAVELREALRGLLFANNSAPVRVQDLEVLDRVAAASDLRPRFRHPAAPAAGADGSLGFALEPAAPGASGALGRLLAAVSGAMAEGTWSRLKACADDGCGWAFYDRSRNRSGHWCSMEVCGNRAKAREFRRRRRSPGRSASGETITRPTDSGASARGTVR